MFRDHWILIVEDDDAIGEALAEALEFQGIRTRRAPHGRAALELLNEGLRPCIILLDLMMPVMNGWEFRAVLKSDGRFASIPVCVVSACANREPPADVLCVLKKPVPLNRLFGVIEKHC